MLTDPARALKGLFAAFALGVLLVACGPKVPRVAPLGPGDVILAFGDSLTYGTGASESESYPAVLARLVDRKIVRAGVPGETTEGGLARLDEVLDEYRPALVILSLGGNDMLRKVDEAVVRENLRRIIQAIRARGIGVVLFGVPRPSFGAGAPEFYADLAREFDIPYEGKIVASVLYSPGEKSDAIHPNAKGYRRMAEAFADLLRKAGAV